MSKVIKDGTGGGANAKVNSDNRLHVDSVGRSQIQQASLDGNAYSLSTSTLSLTSDSESATFFLKYNGTNKLVIQTILIILGDSTGGSGDALISVTKNPTTGTIVSTATEAVNINNRNFSSANILNALIYEGQEGATLTDGEGFINTSRSIFNEPIRLDNAPIVLGGSNSIGVKVTPPSGNTNQICTIGVICFEEKADV